MDPLIFNFICDEEFEKRKKNMKYGDKNKSIFFIVLVNQYIM